MTYCCQAGRARPPGTGTCFARLLRVDGWAGTYASTRFNLGKAGATETTVRLGLTRNAQRPTQDILFDPLLEECKFVKN